jgi:mycothiol system anti-sigma-R factor
MLKGAANESERGCEMNCRESLQKLYEFLDGELEKVPMSEIEMHLNNCRPCWDRFEFEKQLIAVIKKRCCKETCSDQLRKRVQSLLEKY